MYLSKIKNKLKVVTILLIIISLIGCSSKKPEVSIFDINVNGENKILPDKNENGDSFKYYYNEKKQVIGVLKSSKRYKKEDCNKIVEIEYDKLNNEILKNKNYDSSKFEFNVSDCKLDEYLKENDPKEKKIFYYEVIFKSKKENLTIKKNDLRFIEYSLGAIYGIVVFSGAILFLPIYFIIGIVSPKTATKIWTGKW